MWLPVVGIIQNQIDTSLAIVEQEVPNARWENANGEQNCASVSRSLAEDQLLKPPVHCATRSPLVSPDPKLQTRSSKTKPQFSMSER